MVAETYHWRIENHICRSCFGRLLTRIAPKEPRLARCADCGREDQTVRALCVCGSTLADGRSAGLRCTRNQAPAPGAEQEIVGQLVGAAPRKSRPAVTNFRDALHQQHLDNFDQ